MMAIVKGVITKIIDVHDSTIIMAKLRGGGSMNITLSLEAASRLGIGPEKALPPGKKIEVLV